jgi:predicted nucleic acid-binding Zn ribbon protein
MRDPAGDRERMERQRRNRKFIYIFGIVIIIALMISFLGATLRVVG